MKVLLRRRALYVIGGAILFTVVYALLSWLKYRAYMDARYDLGNMVQAVYNTAHGHFLEITSGDPEPRQMSRLGSHVDPILALFALPWLVWPSPVMLLVGQAAIAATGAWPAFRLGTRVTRDPTAGAFLAGAYLLYPALGFLVLNEFHPVALATPLLLWAFLYMEEDRWVRAAVFLVLAAACKETVPLVIAFMGAYFAVRKRSPWPLVVTPRRRGVVRRRRVGRHPALQRRPERLHLPLRGLRQRRGRGGEERAAASRADRRGPALRVQPALPAGAAVAVWGSRRC